MSEYISPEDAARRGIEMAQQLMHAAADSDEGEVLRLLNTSPPAVTANSVAYLLACLRELAERVADGDETKAARVLHAAASAASDVAENVAAVIINEALRRNDA